MTLMGWCLENYIYQYFASLVCIFYYTILIIFFFYIIIYIIITNALSGKECT
jgi:hypothetical protein